MMMTFLSPHQVSIAAATRAAGARALALFFAAFAIAPLAGAVGADIPWTTYEAEAMHTSGAVLGPVYGPFAVETESSGQRCVKLAPGGFVEFTAQAAANTLVIRFSLPDAPAGGGVDSVLALSINGRRQRLLPISSRLAWLYGEYPFVNDPAAGKPRNFYDEIRVKDLSIAAGDVIRVEKTGDDALPCIIDLADLEQVAPPAAAPAGALAVRDFGAVGDGVADDTAALRRSVAEAQRQGRPVWVAPGDYKLTGDIVLPSGVTVLGAGMWHTTFVGDAVLYGQAERRVRFKLMGTGIRLADFAIVGRLDYRSDPEPNDGVIGAGCARSTVTRVWVEHTKVGAWIYNGTDLRVEGCRFRNLLADGINLCVGTSGTVVENCTARGTGDDCFAIWPAAFDQGYVGATPQPGNNVIRRCTGQVPFLANGGALYGGANNRIEDCRFVDITAGCGILVSTSFSTADEARQMDNNFSGTTVVQDCELVRCGGYDHTWAWRGALQLCLERRSISGLRLSRIRIRDSLSDGVAVAVRGRNDGQHVLSDVRLEEVEVTNSGIGAPDRHDLAVQDGVTGSLVVANSALQRLRNSSAEFCICHE